MWSHNVEFLTGTCVATSTDSLTTAEWPPHPARVFMALAATYFETSDGSAAHRDEMFRKSLEWLEDQDPPLIYASDCERRDVLTVFVPVNDTTKADQLLSEKRSRQPRCFPAAVPHNNTVRYVYDSAPPSDIMEGLRILSSDVIRIGHSSSMVRVWVEEEFTPDTESERVSELRMWTCKPQTNNYSKENRMRVLSSGTFAYLEDSYNGKAIDEYAALLAEASVARGAEKASLKRELKKRYPGGLPVSTRPDSFRTTRYICESDRPEPTQPVQTTFDSDLLVLAMHNAPVVGLESTLQLAGALRKRIHDAFPDRKSPEWVGGHREDGSATDNPHMAIVPLPFVGTQHADGHLLGLGIVFPREVSQRERAKELSRIFESSNMDAKGLITTLNLPSFRKLTGKTSSLTIDLIRENNRVRPNALKAETWCTKSTTWETVTPIVLDKFPKKNQKTNRQGWLEEVKAIIADSCVNIGAPTPESITVSHNALLRGVPGSRPGKSGFPAMPNPRSGGTRFHVHARIVFGREVEGPVIVGAGRFVGYGFCKPVVRSKASHRGDRK